MRLFAVVGFAAFVLAGGAIAQEAPKPSPEHEVLKKMVGNWTTTMKFAGMESKGTATYKMDLGGLWLASTYEGDFAGQKFSGKGFDSYDAGKKKYVGVWMDSMIMSPMTLEGTYDKAKKTMTMEGVGPGEGGKSAKFKSISEMPDDDTIHFSMYMDDAKEPGFTIVYKRKK